MSAPLSGVHKSYRKTFKLDEGSLRKLTETLREHIKKLSEKDCQIRYTAYRADEYFFETDELDKVLEDDNSKSRRIRRLLIRIIEKDESSDLDTKEDRSLALIDFDVDDSKPIRVTVRGNDRDWCFLLAEDIDAQIDRTTGGRLKALLSAEWASFFFPLIFSAVITITGAWAFFEATVPEKAVLEPTDPKFDLANAYHGLLFNIRIVYFVLAGFLMLSLIHI